MLLADLLADRVGHGARATPALAAEVVTDAVARTRPAHQALWEQLGRSERALLAAVADGVAPTSRALAADHGLGAGRWTRPPDGSPTRGI